LAVVDDHGAVSLVGAAASVGSAIAPSRLPTASGRRTAGQSRLFDEIFGSDDSIRKKAQKAAASRKQITTAPSAAIADRKGKQTAVATDLGVLIDTPAHTLPPARMLWREMLGAFQMPQASSTPQVAQSLHTYDSREARQLGGLDVDDDGEDDERMAVDGQEEREERASFTLMGDANTAYSASPADVLTEIFKTRCSVGECPASVPRATNRKLIPIALVMTITGTPKVKGAELPGSGKAGRKST
jgi:hypothetical protein